MFDGTSSVELEDIDELRADMGSHCSRRARAAGFGRDGSAWEQRAPFAPISVTADCAYTLLKKMRQFIAKLSKHRSSTFKTERGAQAHPSTQRTLRTHRTHRTPQPTTRGILQVRKGRDQRALTMVTHHPEVTKGSPHEHTAHNTVTQLSKRSAADRHTRYMYCYKRVVKTRQHTVRHV